MLVHELLDRKEPSFKTEEESKNLSVTSNWGKQKVKQDVAGATETIGHFPVCGV